MARQDGTAGGCGWVFRWSCRRNLLANPFADLAKACPNTRVSARHLSTAAQFVALRGDGLEVGLVREHPLGPDLDAVPVVFPRPGSPAWFDQFTGAMRSHGIEVSPQPEDQAFLPEVKLAGVASGRAFAFAPPNWSVPVPKHVVRLPLVGNPLVRRTWVVWPASSRRRDVGRLVAALEDLWRP